MSKASVRTEPLCSIARSLEVIGEKWSLLIVREVFWGHTRFSALRESLGLSSDILTARLAKLVECGVLELHAYQEDGARERFSYHLTEAGLELRLVLGALMQWGDKHQPSGRGPAELLVDDAGETVVLGFIRADGKHVPVTQVKTVTGPGNRLTASRARRSS
jgi:DNA-binding HxlR family transcriptional regulator